MVSLIEVMGVIVLLCLELRRMTRCLEVEPQQQQQTLNSWRHIHHMTLNSHSGLEKILLPPPALIKVMELFCCRRSRLPEKCG